MSSAICVDCATDKYLKAIIAEYDEEGICAHCEEAMRPVITAPTLAAHIEPIMRQNFVPGHFVEGLQEGQPLEGVLYEVLGQELEFVDEVIEELVELDPADIRRGDEQHWADDFYYVETPVSLHGMHAQWEAALAELKQSRRFFSPAAHELFSMLFSDVDQLSLWRDLGQFKGQWEKVTFEVAAGKELFRARVCSSAGQRTAFFKFPAKELGPPPSEHAREGRMNAGGVTVFYGALSHETAIAELRPAIGMEVVTATFKTTAPLRFLDFALLEEARGEVLSYLQSDFGRQVEKNHFLKRLHRLISQPIVPGRESDYLITQTMAEYLSHVVQPAFNGVMFSSAQHDGGVNVVLFRNEQLLVDEVHKAFPVEIELKSITCSKVRGVCYDSEPMRTYVSDSGVVAYLARGDDGGESGY